MSSGPRWCEALKQTCPPEELLHFASKGGESYERIRPLLRLLPFSELLPKPPVPKVVGRIGCTGMGEAPQFYAKRLDAACSCRQLLTSLVIDDNPLPPGH